MHKGKTPTAIGSSVPVCPILFTPVSLLSSCTPSWDVIPAGFNRLMIPSLIIAPRTLFLRFLIRFRKMADDRGGYLFLGFLQRAFQGAAGRLFMAAAAKGLGNSRYVARRSLNAGRP